MDHPNIPASYLVSEVLVALDGPWWLGTVPTWRRGMTSWRLLNTDISITSIVRRHPVLTLPDGQCVPISKVFVSFRNFPLPRWTIFHIHALHLVGIDVEVFHPLERLPATAESPFYPECYLSSSSSTFLAVGCVSFFRLLRCWDYYLTHCWELFQWWMFFFS